MKKSDVIRNILRDKPSTPRIQFGQAFAPTNIALCKYWGKRDLELNLPINSSLSISLGDKGATTFIAEIESDQDSIVFNEQSIALHSSFGNRLTTFLDLFRPLPTVRYQVITQMNIPVASGLASSACGFAALVLALNHFYHWDLDLTQLSILARLGSGSAARSLWQGFVKWEMGSAKDGMDSHGHVLPIQWPELRVGLLILHTGQKPLSSREAMLRTVQTSHLYSAWPKQVDMDMQSLERALVAKDFNALGRTAENNAMAMHATMMSAWPAIVYSQPATIGAMNQVWELRKEGVSVYFTQDAGPNLKLLFLAENQEKVMAAFPDLEMCEPFG
jgi:diphosphomevalonate decarboxylase